MLTPKEICSAACGRDSSDQPRAQVLIENKIVSQSKPEKMISSSFITTGELDIFRNGKYVQVDIIFTIPKAIELIETWSVLQEFGRNVNSMDEETDELPMMFVTIVPDELIDKHYMVGISPVFWTLTYKDVSDSAPTIIRMIFDNDDFLFYQTETDDKEDNEPVEGPDFEDIEMANITDEEDEVEFEEL